MGCGAETKDLILEDQKGCIARCEEFKYLGVNIGKEDRQENIKNRVLRGRGIRKNAGYGFLKTGS